MADPTVESIRTFRAAMSPEERKRAIAEDIASVRHQPKTRAYYRFIAAIKEEGPLPGYKSLAYFEHAEVQREEMRRKDEAFLDAWAAANG